MTDKSLLPAEGIGVPSITVAFGIFLSALGLWGWLGAEPEHQSWTALVPVFVGGPLIVLGLLAFKESLLKHAMHLAAMLGLLGFLAAGTRLAMKPTVATRAGQSVAVMTALCGLFVILCINSFIQARRRRKSRAVVGSP